MKKRTHTKLVFQKPQRTLWATEATKAAASYVVLHTKQQKYQQKQLISHTHTTKIAMPSRTHHYPKSTYHNKYLTLLTQQQQQTNTERTQASCHKKSTHDDLKGTFSHSHAKLRIQFFLRRRPKQIYKVERIATK